MGTRNLTMVTIGGETKVSQYGQWDGYPTGQGATVQKFIQFLLDNPEERVPELAARVGRVEDAPRGMIKSLYEALGIDISSGSVNMSDAAKFKQAHPQFDRDMGAEILDWIYNRPDDDLPIFLQVDTEFLKDHLFCEWAYDIRMDDFMVDVHHGYDSRSVRSFTFQEFAQLNLEEFQSSCRE